MQREEAMWQGSWKLGEAVTRLDTPGIAQSPEGKKRVRGNLHPCALPCTHSQILPEGANLDNTLVSDVCPSEL